MTLSLREACLTLELTGRETTAKSFKSSMRGMLIPLPSNDLLGFVHLQPFFHSRPFNIDSTIQCYERRMAIKFSKGSVSDSKREAHSIQDSSAFN
jgi:hypothetical protein